MSFLSALGGAAGGLLGGIISNASSISSQQRQNRYNREMWSLENEYNKPINQMNRLREAGINPNVAFANGTGGNTSAHFSTSANRDTSVLGAGVQHGLDNVLNLRQTLQNMRIAREAQNNDNRETSASVAVKKAEVSRIRAEAARLSRENSVNEGHSERDPFWFRIGDRAIRNSARSVSRSYNSLKHSFPEKKKVAKMRAKDAMRDILIDSGLNPSEFGY